MAAAASTPTRASFLGSSAGASQVTAGQKHHQPRPAALRQRRLPHVLVPGADSVPSQLHLRLEL